MAHQFNEHRDHHVAKRRVGHIVRGYATGGGVRHDDEIEDVNLIKKTVKKAALKRVTGKIRGRAAGGRLDRKGRKRGDTHVNVMIGPQGGGAGAGAPPILPPGLAGAAGAPPLPPPRPPMPPMAAGPGGPPPGMPPGMPPIRKRGGRVKKRAEGGDVEGSAKSSSGRERVTPEEFTERTQPDYMKDAERRQRARGGALKSGPAWEEGRRNGTQPAKPKSNTDDAEVLREHQGVKKVRTYARGGAAHGVKDVSHNSPPAFQDDSPKTKGVAGVSRNKKPAFAKTAEGRSDPFPKGMTAGGHSGVGRLQKTHAVRGGVAP